MDRKLYNTPAKVVEFGLRRVITEQIRMLEENAVHTKELLNEIRRLECVEIAFDKRITMLNTRLGLKVARKNKNTRTEADMRVQVKRLQSQLAFHKAQSIKHRQRIHEMELEDIAHDPHPDLDKVMFGDTPAVQPVAPQPKKKRGKKASRSYRPRGDYPCSKCGVTRDHYKGCAYCTVCWKNYKPCKDGQIRYEKKRVRLNRNGVRTRIPREQPNESNQMGRTNGQA